MGERLITVAVANQEGKILLPISEVKEWEIKTKMYMGGAVYITTEEGTYGIKVQDFNEIFNK